MAEKARYVRAPNITGEATARGGDKGAHGAVYIMNGAFLLSQVQNKDTISAIPLGNTTQYIDLYSLDASRSSTLFGASSTVQPLSAGVQYLIKY